MIDVHCHLQFHAFENDYEDVAARAFAAGVTRIINVGTQIESSKKGIDLTKKYDQMYAIVGVHPHHADKLLSGWDLELERLANEPKVVAIGEVGIDYFSYKSNGIVDPQMQKMIFEKQIEIAYRLGLPLQIHQRQAEYDLLDVLIYHRESLLEKPGMLHCFAGSIDFLKKALDLGFYIGFDGNVTYSGLAPGETIDLKDHAKYTPLDRIVVETDAPYLTPIPHRGTRNEPAYVIITGRFLADLKGISYDEFVAQIQKNVYTVFTRLQ